MKIIIFTILVLTLIATASGFRAKSRARDHHANDSAESHYNVNSCSPTFITGNGLSAQQWCGVLAAYHPEGSGFHIDADDGVQHVIDDGTNIIIVPMSLRTQVCKYYGGCGCCGYCYPADEAAIDMDHTCSASLATS